MANRSEPAQEMAAAEAAYRASSQELFNAINSLEASLSTLVGKDGIQGEIMAQTRARLATELSSQSAAPTRE